VGQALKLMEMMSCRCIDGLRQDIIGLHLLQKADAATIADRLKWPLELVRRVLAESKPLIQEFEADKS
jgi:hypothetical protein